MCLKVFLAEVTEVLHLGHQLVMACLSVWAADGHCALAAKPPDINRHLRENEPAEKQAGRYTGSGAETEKGASKRMPTLKTGYISNRHSSALKFSMRVLSE